MTPAADTIKEVSVAEEVYKSGTLAAVTADINVDLDIAEHLTLVNDDVTCGTESSISSTVDVAVEGSSECLGVNKVEGEVVE